MNARTYFSAAYLIERRETVKSIKPVDDDFLILFCIGFAAGIVAIVSGILALMIFM